MSHRVFISYRRSDAAGHAGRLFDRLRHWLDPQALFFDAASIDSGAVFPEVLRQAVQQAQVVLVLIGPDWTAELNRRSALPEVDFVRAEVAQALARLQPGGGTVPPVPLVLPVLLGGAAMPAIGDLDTRLQAELAALPALNAHAFVGNQLDWDQQFKALRDRIAGRLGSALHYRPPPEQRVPWGLIEHTPSPCFQDPADRLGALRQALVAGRSSALLASQALYGMGGVGKTQLALHYSLQYRDAYPGGVWWLRAEQAVTLQQDALDACRAAGIDVASGELPTAALRRGLAGESTAWLLVFDNAEDPAALRPHLPGPGPHHVIVTSRHPGWSGLLAGTVQMQVWTEPQGAAFLAERLARHADAVRSDLLGRLSQALGGLPLALEQAAAYLDHSAMPVAEYIAALAKADTTALVLDEGRAATGYERSVLQTLQVAFPRLGGPAQRLLRLLAWCAAEPLPERWLRDAPALLPDGLRELAAQPLAWSRCVAELRQYALVERLQITALDRLPGDADPRRTEPALQVHRLTQEVVRHVLGDAAVDRALCLRLLHEACPGDPTEPAHWAAASLLLPHVRRQVSRLDEPGFNRPAFGHLVHQMAVYLQHGPALYADAVALFRLALRLSEESVGPHDPVTLTVMSNLGLALQEQGDLVTALAVQTQELALSRQAAGEETPQILASKHNLALTLLRMDRLADAQALLQEVLDAHLRHHRPGHPSTRKAMNNLAVTLREAGDLDGAHRLHTEELALTRQSQGTHHPDTLASMNNLALTLEARGDLTAARDHQRDILRLCREVYGNVNLHTATAMNNLAVTLARLGDIDEALLLQTQALQQKEALQGAANADSLKARRSLAAMQQEALALLLRPSQPRGSSPLEE